MRQEIGLETDQVQYLFKFHYTVGYRDIGAENEICAITEVKGIESGWIFPDPDEISEIRTIAPGLLIGEMAENRDIYTPWLIIAVERMRENGFL